MEGHKPARSWVPMSPVVLAQEHALAHSVTYTRLFRVGEQKRCDILGAGFQSDSAPAQNREDGQG